MKIVIDIPDQKYKWIVDNPQAYTDDLCEAVRNGTPLPKGHSFIAICDNDYTLSEDVIDDLKSTLFVGDTDDSGKVTYCFTMKEIIEGSDSE